MATYLNKSHFEIFHKNGVRHLNLAVKLHSLGGAMKNFPCDILRNNVEIGWYRANAGPIQAGQCWADTIGPMLGRFRQVHRLLSWCVQCTGSVPFVPLPVQTVLASITPALAQYLYVCWDTIILQLHTNQAVLKTIKPKLCYGFGTFAETFISFSE